MASHLPQSFYVDLTDPETNKTYTITVTADEIKLLNTDDTFVNSKLQEAKYIEYAEFISENDTENIEALDPDLNGDESIDEPMKSPSEVSIFKWPHEAILLLLDEYQKRQTDFSSGKISQKTLWKKISTELQSHGHNITGPQCMSKFSGMKKTYKKTKDHNNKSGNSAKHWPYLTLMDDLMGNKPFITPIAVCSSTGKKRTLSESSSGSSSSNDLDKLANQKKAKTTPATHLIAALEERSMKSEENKERRFKEFMAFKAQKAEETREYKRRALDLLEKLVNSDKNF